MSNPCTWTAPTGESCVETGAMHDKPDPYIDAVCYSKPETCWHHDYQPLTIDIRPDDAGYVRIAEAFIDSILAYSTFENTPATRDLLSSTIEIVSYLCAQGRQNDVFALMQRAKGVR